MKKILSALFVFCIIASALSFASYALTDIPNVSATEFAQELKEMNGEASQRLIVGSNNKLDSMGAVGTACGPNGTYVLQFDSDESTQKAYKYYNSLSYVRYVEYDSEVDNAFCSTEGGYDFVTNCASTADCNIDDAIKLINKVKGDDLPEIRVAIIDSGIARTSVTNDRIDGGHTFIEGANEDGTTIILNNSNTQHGTYVAGTIIQNTLSNVRLYSYQDVRAEDGSSMASYSLSSIYLAVENNCKIISMSLAYNSQSTSGRHFIEAVDYATAQGCFCIAAAGNNSTTLENSTNYPGLCENAITVGAVDPNRKLCSFSNFGEGVDIYATGKAMVSYNSNGAEYNGWQGTSAATPVVSSICALLLEIKPDITVDEVKELLIETGSATSESDITDDHRVIADAYECVKALTGQELEKCDLQFEIVGKTITFYSDTEGAKVYYYNNLGTIQTAYREFSSSRCYQATLGEPISPCTNNAYVVIACAYAPGKAKSKIELLKIPVFDYEYGYLINEANATQQYNIFSRCEITDEQTMIVPETINGVEVQEIGAYCYMGNQMVETIILPDTVEQIDAYAFANCPNLKTVVAPGVLYCDHHAFYDCLNLKNVEMPLVTQANTAMFKDCTSLTCLNTGELTTVCNHAFKGCESLDLNNKAHSYEVVSCQPINNDNIVTICCSKCEDEYTESFCEHINQNYPTLDLNGDGIVNAKDYAIIMRGCA